MRGGAVIAASWLNAGLRNLRAGPLALFVAAKGLASPGKGATGSAVPMARLYLDGEHLTLLVRGPESAPPASVTPRFRTLCQLNDDVARMLALNAADITQMLSSHENLPNVVAKRLASGTLVAGFAVGGVKEMMDRGRNGRLVAVGDHAGLAVAVQELFRQRDAAWLRAQACAKAESEIDIERTSRAYLELYLSDVREAEQGAPPNPL